MLRRTDRDDRNPCRAGPEDAEEGPHADGTLPDSVTVNRRNWRGSNDFAQYLVEPTDMLISRFDTATVTVEPGQPAKTTIGEKRLPHTDAVDPDRLLWHRAPTRPFQAGLRRRT